MPIPPPHAYLPYRRVSLIDLSLPVGYRPRKSHGSITIIISHIQVFFSTLGFHGRWSFQRLWAGSPWLLPFVVFYVLVGHHPFTIVLGVPLLASVDLTHPLHNIRISLARSSLVFSHTHVPHAHPCTLDRTALNRTYTTCCFVYRIPSPTIRRGGVDIHISRYDMPSEIKRSLCISEEEKRPDYRLPQRVGTAPSRARGYERQAMWICLQPIKERVFLFFSCLRISQLSFTRPRHPK